MRFVEVKVLWEDSKSYGNDWMDAEEAENLDIAHCETQGFLVKEDKDKIIIAQTHGGNQYHNLVVIPKRSIIGK